MDVRRFFQRFVAVLGSLLLVSNPMPLGQLWAQESKLTTGEASDWTAPAALSAASGALSAGELSKAINLAGKAAELDRDSFRIQQASAEILYLAGAPEESLAPFDRAVKLAPDIAPQNWQRGIALATCGKFEAGAKQFETHHKVNPDDVENTAWYFLCVAKSKGIEAARKSLIPSRGDPREPMMTILKMYNGKAEAKDVLAAADENTQPGSRRELARFYADLYIGLYWDAAGDAKQARKYLESSLKRKTGGYMFDTARVYLETRLLETPQGEAAKPAKGSGDK